MGDLISFVKAAFESPSNSILTIILFLAAAKGVYEVIKWGKNEINTWYKKRQEEEKKVEDVEERLTALETENHKQFEKLDNIDATLQNVTATLETIAVETNKRFDEINENTKKHFDEMDAKTKERSVISNRSILYRLHGEFMEKKSLTMAEREMFDAVSSEYLSCGGNSLFKSKIIPEVEALPVKD